MATTAATGGVGVVEGPRIGSAWLGWGGGLFSGQNWGGWGGVVGDVDGSSGAKDRAREVLMGGHVQADGICYGSGGEEGC